LRQDDRKINSSVLEPATENARNNKTSSVASSIFFGEKFFILGEQQ